MPGEDVADGLGADARGATLAVALQLAAGRSNQEIARQRFLSPNTVKLHVRAIYERMGVHNRVEAARLLERLHHPH
jgi:DNA-binding NarL/FixJ family response regulator